MKETDTKKWTGVEAPNIAAIKQSIQESRHQASLGKTVLDLKILRAEHIMIGHCTVKPNKEDFGKANEFRLNLWLKPSETSLKLKKDIITTLTEWARKHLAPRGFKLVYPVAANSEESRSIIDTKRHRYIREHSQMIGGQTEKITDYELPLD